MPFKGGTYARASWMFLNALSTSPSGPPMYFSTSDCRLSRNRRLRIIRKMDAASSQSLAMAVNLWNSR